MLQTGKVLYLLFAYHTAESSAGIIPITTLLGCSVGNVNHEVSTWF